MPLVALLLATPPVAAYDYDFEDNGMYYLITSEDDLTCAVATGNKAYAGNVVIPATVTFEGVTYKVTAIAANAFKDCKRLKSIDLGNVTEMGDYAFSGCTSLATIDLKNVTEISSSAFSGCTSLTTIDLKNVTKIGTSAFLGCRSLTTIDLKNVTKLGASAFANCTCLESVDLQNFTKLSGTFYGCSSLKKVEGTQNLKTLFTSYSTNGDIWGSFEGCSSLTSLDLPNVYQVGERTFSDSNLTSIILPNCSVVTYNNRNNNNTFCSKALTTLAIPNVIYFVGKNSLPLTLTELVLGKRTHLYDKEYDTVYEAFDTSCKTLKKVTFLSAEPRYEQIGSDWFPNADIYVPKGSASAYKEYKAKYPNCCKNIYEFEPEVKMSESAVTIRLDGRYQLSAMVLPYYDSTNIQWESSNPSVADVSSKGVVFALSEGSATITAKYGDATATCAVKVSKTESVEDVKADAATEYDVYNLQGIMVRSKCDKADIYDLPGGIYILVSPQGRTKVRI